MVMIEYTPAQILRCRPQYLDDLGRLVGRQVHAEELLSPLETRCIGDEKLANCPKETRCFRAPFVCSEDFQNLLEILQKLNTSPISIWIEHTRGIGALVVRRLSDIDFTEVFNIGGELAVFVAIDGKDQMLVTNDVDEKSETIELQGFNWSNGFDLFDGGTLLVVPTASSSSH